MSVDARSKKRSGLSVSARPLRDEAGCRFPIRTISADIGTPAEKIMNELLTRFPKLSRVRDCAAGLYLATVPGDRFSLKYRESGGVYVLPIGRNLSATRIKHATESIAAMLCRGPVWIDSRGETHLQGFGEAPVIRPKKAYKKPPRHTRYSFC